MLRSQALLPAFERPPIKLLRFLESPFGTAQQAQIAQNRPQTRIVRTRRLLPGGQ